MRDGSFLTHMLNKYWSKVDLIRLLKRVKDDGNQESFTGEWKKSYTSDEKCT